MSPQEIAKQFNGPASKCTCGHNGDGPGSQHKDGGNAGHEHCKVKGCPCPKFVWAGFTVSFQEALSKGRLSK